MALGSKEYNMPRPTGVEVRPTGVEVAPQRFGFKEGNVTTTTRPTGVEIPPQLFGSKDFFTTTGRPTGVEVAPKQHSPILKVPETSDEHKKQSSHI